MAAPGGEKPQKITEGEKLQDMAAPEDKKPQEMSAPEGEKPQEMAAPGGEKPREMSAPEDEKSQEMSAPEGEKLQEMAAPGEEKPQEMSAPEDEKPQEMSAPGREKPQELAAPEDEKPHEMAAPEDEKPHEMAAPEDEKPHEMAAPEDKKPHEMAAPEDEKPHEMAAPEDEKPHEMAAPEDEKPQEMAAPEDEKPQEMAAPEDEKPQEMAAPEDEKPHEMAAPEGEKPQEMVAPEGEKPQEMAAPGGEKPREMSAPGGEKPHEMSAPEGEKPQEMAAPGGEKPQEMVAPEGEKPQEMAAPGGEKPREMSAPGGEKPQEMSAPEGEKPQEMSAPEGEKPQEMVAPEGEKPQEMSAPEGEKLREMSAPEGEKPQEMAAPEGEIPREMSAPEGEKPQEMVAPEDEIPREMAALEDKAPPRDTMSGDKSETSHTDLSELEKFLEYGRKKHNPEQIKVVIMDVEDIHSERKITDWWMAGKYSDYELLALSKVEMKLLIDHKINLLSPERRMANKVRHMHRILQEAAEKSRIQKWQLLYKPKNTFKSILYNLGVPTRSLESDYSWMTELLHSDDFKDHFSEVTNDKSRKLSSENCSFGILYYTNKNGQINQIDATDVQLIQQHSSVGKNNMIIVMDGVKDSSDQEKIRILRRRPNMEELRHNLFLISHQEKSSKYQNLLSSLLRINKPQQPANVPKAEPEVHVGEEAKHAEDHVDEVAESVEVNVREAAGSAEVHVGTVVVSGEAKPDMMSNLRDMRNIPRNLGIFGPPVLGIFSRSSKEEYSWLEAMLRPRFTVKCFYISNNGFRQFMGEVSQCRVGILYHSKNRGRMNVTDVTDSLYDNELEYMSTKLGKKKVWVVIDDVDDNSEGVKKEILHNQPKIQNLAQELYLIKHGTSEQKVRDLERNKHLFSSPVFR